MTTLNSKTLPAAIVLASLSLTAHAAFPPRPVPPPPPQPAPELNTLDASLANIIAAQGLTGVVAAAQTAPKITEPLAQLGMKLFFSKALGGEKSVACASCHHPALGGADGLSLPVGVNAIDANVIGPGRRAVQNEVDIPRNSPTVFNAGLAERALFWDGRVERITRTAANGETVTGVSTPDSGIGRIDPAVPNDLLDALARFPVTSTEEMRGTGFTTATNNQQIRTHIAERIGDYGALQGDLDTNDWLAEFRAAYNSAEPAETLITFDSIAMALGEYQHAMTFVDTNWHRYVRGDKQALSDAQKRGAISFFTPVNQGGAGCVACHSGERFTNEGFFNLAFPQMGIGKGENHEDLGRGHLTPQPRDQFAFKVPSLINVAVTAPYGHAGVYQNLDEVVRHYVNPPAAVDAFFARGGACSLRQFNRSATCDSLNTNSMENSEQALQLLGQSPFQPARLNREQQQDLVAFLQALTDNCVMQTACLRQFIPANTDSDPDNLRLNAVNRIGNPL
ncbi:cytochrome-c peroxidase [Pseudoalteromonas fenneropenaei]|uniref:Cytochrome-c peroxidase n=1 Tax=Pseudoalteromonas fenneropenaei TaxID=1737459 RepID=A0ABV7CI55_9GAMM